MDSEKLVPGSSFRELPGVVPGSLDTPFNSSGTKFAQSREAARKNVASTVSRIETGNHVRGTSDDRSWEEQSQLAQVIVAGNVVSTPFLSYRALKKV